MNLICVPPTDVVKIWHGDVARMIDAGFAARDVPMPRDILDQLHAGTRLLWLAVTPESQIVAAMLTQLFEMRSGKMCKMMECGGDRLREWKHLRAEIEQYAKREGCDRVLVDGRPGWSRIMTDYTVTGVTLEKRI